MCMNIVWFLVSPLYSALCHDLWSSQYPSCYIVNPVHSSILVPEVISIYSFWSVEAGREGGRDNCCALDLLTLCLFALAIGLQQGRWLVGIGCTHLWNGCRISPILCRPTYSDLWKDCFRKGEWVRENDWLSFLLISVYLIAFVA